MKGGALAMPYCPECLTEYQEGVTECVDCGALLRPGAPPVKPQRLEGRKGKLVRLRTFSGATAQLDADLARNILETEGIPCILAGENSAELLPVLDVPLLVLEEDADRAAEMLKSFLDSAEPLPSE
jgi:hypothetical protein